MQSEVEAKLIAWVREWLDLVGEGRLAEACEKLDGDVWTPARLIAVIEDQFGPDTRFAASHPEGPRFTPTQSARGDAAASVGAFTDGSGFWVDHSVPLNGEYSDLTAQFEFRRMGDTLLTTLYDLRVM